MRFFSCIVRNKERTEIEVPDGLCLKVRVAALNPADLKCEFASLQVKTSVEREATLLSCFSNSSQLTVSLQHIFSSMDSPIEFSAIGGSVHLSGNWMVDEEDLSIFDEASDSVVSDIPLEVVGESIHPSSEKAEVVTTEAAIRAVKKRTSNKRARNGQIVEENSLQAPSIVVAQGAPEDSSHLRKRWNVKPQNDEGLLVDDPCCVTKSNGVLVKDYVIGRGKEPKLGAEVKIVYEGMFPDGRIFDSKLKRKKPFVFRKGTGDVVRGLDLGIAGMRVGGSREITIPSELG